jgi:hypothetical protein
MKKIIVYFYLSIIVFAGSSCKKDSNSPTGNLPVADFTFTPSNGYKPLNVQFTDKSTNVTSYEWDFGNGQTSNLKNPTTVFINDGVYTITLKVINKDGTDKITKTISVKNPPKSVKIKSVTIVEFPETDENGDNWDSSLSGSFPDVYFQITDENSETLYSLPTGNRKENLRRIDLPFTFTSTSFYYEFKDLNKGVGVRLYDAESFIADQYMGGVLTTMTFNQRIASGSLPNEISLSFGAYSFKLGLEWVL